MPFQTPSAPPAPPAPPSPDAPVLAPLPRITSTGSPEAVYNALKAQRQELGRQLESLEERRGELSQRLQQGDVNVADRVGIEQRIRETDQRIAEVDKQIAASERDVAQAAGVPGAVVEPPPPPVDNDPPEAFIAVPIVLTLFVLFPLTLAYTRRIWRRGSAVIASLPAELSERLTRLEQAVDTIAIETERISEGQRFLSKLFADTGARGALNPGAGAQQPVEVKASDPVRRWPVSGGGRFTADLADSRGFSGRPRQPQPPASGYPAQPEVRTTAIAQPLAQAAGSPSSFSASARASGRGPAQRVVRSPWSCVAPSSMEFAAGRR
jgi:hypothetical protein